jgi:hypothetical protein
MSHGWRDDANGTGVLVGSFEQQPHKSATTFSTIGLSDHVVSSESGRSFREELLFATTGAPPGPDVARLLMHVAERMLGGHKALLRGDTVSIEGTVHPGFAVVGLYAAIPVMFDETLHVFSGSIPPTVFVWLFPISASELSYIASCGWSKFEDILAEADVDLLDIGRGSVV